MDRVSLLSPVGVPPIAVGRRAARLADARARGDHTAFDQGLAEGQTWTIDDAVAAGVASAAGADA